MYFRLSIQGTIAGGEVWSVNPCFSIQNEIGGGWDQALGQAAVNAVAAIAIPSFLGAVLSNAASIVSYRLEGRDDDHTLLGIAEAARATPYTGTGAPSKNATASAVLSLRSERPGPSGRGRLYWPALGVTLSATTFRIPAATTAAWAEDASSYLTAIQNAIRDNGGFSPGTAITLAVISKTTGGQYPVTRIMVGDVLDTQRRRRDRFQEAYASEPYPAS